MQRSCDFFSISPLKVCAADLLWNPEGYQSHESSCSSNQVHCFVEVKFLPGTLPSFSEDFAQRCGTCRSTDLFLFNAVVTPPVQPYLNPTHGIPDKSFDNNRVSAELFFALNGY